MYTNYSSNVPISNKIKTDNKLKYKMKDDCERVLSASLFNST